jgi:hypothetical protein
MTTNKVDISDLVLEGFVEDLVGAAEAGYDRGIADVEAGGPSSVYEKFCDKFDEAGYDEDDLDMFLETESANLTAQISNEIASSAVRDDLETILSGYTEDWQIQSLVEQYVASFVGAIRDEIEQEDREPNPVDEDDEDEDEESDDDEEEEEDEESDE